MPSRIPRRLSHLVDDAAVFPPGEAPLRQAVADHADHLASPHADLVGPLVIGTQHLPDVADLATVGLLPRGLRVSLVVPTPDRLDAALADIAAIEQLLLATVEVTVDRRFAPDQVSALVSATRPLGVTVFVEIPRSASNDDWARTADVVAEHGWRLKFRTGGTAASAFPSESEVASWIRGAVARGVPFKCTAGLHRAARHRDPDTGFEHHGYLNVLLATKRALLGASLEEIESTLAQADATVLAAEIAAATDGQLYDTRRAFTSYGSCSILEPLGDLAALDLLYHATL